MRGICIVFRRAYGKGDGWACVVASCIFNGPGKGKVVQRRSGDYYSSGLRSVPGMESTLMCRLRFVYSD